MCVCLRDAGGPHAEGHLDPDVGGGDVGECEHAYDGSGEEVEAHEGGGDREERLA